MSKIESTGIFKELENIDPFNVKSLRPYETKPQMVFFYIMVGLPVITILFALLNYFFHIPDARAYALLATFIAFIAACLYQISIALKGLKTIIIPGKIFFPHISKIFNKHHKIVFKLSEYPVIELEHAYELLKTEIEQMKNRMRVFVGAIEKVGIIPVFIGWLIAYINLYNKTQILSEFIYYLPYGLLAFYIISIIIYFFNQRLEQYLIIMEIALNNQKKGK